MLQSTAQSSNVTVIPTAGFTLPATTTSLQSAYKQARPFPHLIIDGLFPNSTLDKLIDEMKSIPSHNWVHHHEDHLEKFNSRSALELGEVGRQLTAILHSAAFLYTLSEITGIWDLLPDPYLEGGGYHLLPPGGHFDVHVDRNTAYITGLTRRLALIVYLNKSWRHEYGGQLEFWNPSATAPEVIVEPLFNRAILFEISDSNYHGVPNKVCCPPGQSRNSFVVYYHTVGSDRQSDIRPHTSLYLPTRYQQAPGTSLRQLIKDLTPPLLWRALRKFKN